MIPEPGTRISLSNRPAVRERESVNSPARYDCIIVGTQWTALGAYNRYMHRGQMIERDDCQTDWRIPSTEPAKADKPRCLRKLDVRGKFDDYKAREWISNAHDLQPGTPRNSDSRSAWERSFARAISSRIIQLIHVRARLLRAGRANFLIKIK